MALTNNVFNTKTSNFANLASKYAMPSPTAPTSNFSLAGITSPKTTNTSFLNASGATKQTLSQRRQALGQSRLDAINNATSLDNLAKPKWTTGAGVGNYTAQKQAYKTKLQEFSPPKEKSPSEWSKGAEGKWGTALAGFDSVVNLTNAAMNWVNMGKQWDYMNKSMNLAEQQFNEEKKRYDERENERKTNNTNITNAFNAYYTNRANSSAMSADTNAAQAKAAQAQNAQNPQNNAQNAQDNQNAQAPQDEERKPLPMERE